MSKYAWHTLSDGRQVYKKMEEWHDRRSSLPIPYFRQDSIDPVRGMDGRMHDTLSGYRRTLRADGNPQGESYTEIGNEETKAYVAPEFDRKSRRNDIKRAIADVKNGNVPPA